MANLRAPVPAWLNKTYMERILRNYLNKPNIKVTTIKITPGSKEGDNYSCQVLRIMLNYKDGDESKQISIIVKIKQDVDSLDPTDSTMHLFPVEAAVYKTFFPTIKQITPAIEKKLSPEFYHVDYEHNSLFLEDLVQKQYVMPTRHQLLGKEEALLTMETLASLHGASYRAVQLDPSLKVTFHESMWGSKPNKPMENWYYNAVKGLEMNVDSYGLPEEWCKMLRGVGNRLRKEAFKVCDLQEGDLNLICHGDLWMNNLMYHLTDGVIDDVLILDYEFVAYRSFAMDLHFIIFSSVQADVLINNLDTILETYYNKLKTVAPEIPNLTLKRVRKEFFDKKYYGLVQCVYFRPVVHATKPLDLELMDAGGVDEMGYKNPVYPADLHKLMPFLEKAGFFSEDF